MTVPNDSITITPGTGATVATHLIGGKEHQAVVVVGPSGHIVDSLDTWYFLADLVAPAANKHLLSIYNAAGSGKVVKVRKVFLTPLLGGTLTGVACRVDLRRFQDGAHTAGTDLVAVAADTANTALPAQITAKTGGTITETNAKTLFPFTFTNDEVGATQAFPSSLILQATNLIPEGREIQEVTIREGFGLTVKFITASTVNTFSVLAVATVE